MATFEIQERDPRPALAVRLRTPLEEIPAALAEALHEAWHAAEAIGLAPDGPPYARYFGEPAATVEYEGGVMLPAPAAAGLGRATPTELPGGRVAVAWHVGPYDTLGETYRALLACLTARELPA
jgi:effector-binding domain-containing protein